MCLFFLSSCLYLYAPHTVSVTARANQELTPESSLNFVDGFPAAFREIPLKDHKNCQSAAVSVIGRSNCKNSQFPRLIGYKNVKEINREKLAN